ncbi:hypothetical protein [Rhodococcus sp. B10]|uniref:hypothetical protein n=1 Tax=Rhodococcus sp. B10 TaxID=2695876 RepID=UPI0014309783|nr:hypothetical protein [Rhodococcus sp. B10]NIL77670.1 hypothetical protein [Rhodococcus sp. B10]
MTTLDLQAILDRADAATEGPWRTEPSKYVRQRYVVQTDTRRTIWHATNDVFEAIDAEFIAAARTDVPLLVARVRELEAVPRVLDPRKLSAEEIEAALDALPGRAVVTCNAFDEPGVWIRTRPQEWHGSGLVHARTSRYLARYCAPLQVIR